MGRREEGRWRWREALCFAVAAVCLPISAQPSAPPDVLRANERAVREVQQRPVPQADVFTPGAAEVEPVLPGLIEEAGCQNDLVLQLQGHPANWNAQPHHLLTAYAGRCLGPASLNRLLAELNLWYQTQGLITTRVYLQGQKLQPGPLVLRVVPGTVQSIAINGDVSDARIASAFAIQVGELLNLRDLEQGLENINRLPSQQAQLSLLPGDLPGASKVEVTLSEKSPVRKIALLDNSGTSAMGRWKATFELGVDNLTDRNDQLSVGLLHNLDRGQLHAQFQGLTFNYLQPSGRHLWLASASWIDTQFKLPGINASYGLQTRALKLGVGHEYIFYRDQVSKHGLMTGLDLSRQMTRIEDFEVPSQTRRLSVLHVGIKGKYFHGNQVYEWWARAEQGVRSFHAQTSLPDGTDPQYRLLKLRLSANWPVPDNQGLVRIVLFAQLAPANTPTLAQVYVGGRYDVRGYQQNSLSAPSGWYVRNEYETPAWSVVPGRLSAYAGLDLGRVQAIPGRPLSQQHLAGQVLGLRLGYEAVQMELAWAHALSRPVEFGNESRNHVYAQLSITF